MDPLTVAAILVLAAVAAFIQALSGFGFSLFIVPPLAVILGPQDTVVLANLLGFVGNSLQFVRLRAHVDRRQAARLAAGSFIGMPIGLAVLLLVDPLVLQFVIAMAVILFTVVLMRGLELHGGGTPGDVAVGLASGVLNTSTSMSGPPVIIYLHGKRLPPQVFRATITAFFLSTGVVALVLLAGAGTIRWQLLALVAASFPAMELGRRTGNRMFDRVNEVFFRRLVYVILLTSATVAMTNAVLKS